MSVWIGKFDKNIVRYGPLILSHVSNVKESFGNKTIIEPIRFQEFNRYLGFSGGNVAITVTGWMKGDGRRIQKLWWEAMRNVQAALAHFPGTIPDADGDSGIGFGQIGLYILLTIMFDFHSEMCYQWSMAIKTMEFERSGTTPDEYAYSIVFEKLSWGIFQFIIDSIISVAYGFTILPRGVSDSTKGLSPKATLQSFVDANRSNFTPLGVDVVVLPEPVTDTNDIGQLTKVVSDDTQEFQNIPYVYAVKPDIDRDLEWKKLPFLEVFPQSFTFTIGDDLYEAAWRVMDYTDEDENIIFQLRLELQKNGEYIYLGKITPQMQFIFDSDISIYISNFEISAAEDGFISHTITGMVALND
jgi:hypothetical protein